MPLLLLSKSNPLRWALIWLFFKFQQEGFEPFVIPERFRRAAAGASGDIVHEVPSGTSNPSFSAKAKILSRKWQDFCFVFFILQFSVFILQLLRQVFYQSHDDAPKAWKIFTYFQFSRNCSKIMKRHFVL